jgi:hypothetical protein
MNAFLQALLEFLKNNPQAIATILEIIKQIIALLEKHPDQVPPLVNWVTKK